MDKLNNEAVLERAETRKTLITMITNRQMTYVVIYVPRKIGIFSQYRKVGSKVGRKKRKGQTKTNLCRKHEKKNGTIFDTEQDHTEYKGQRHLGPGIWAAGAAMILKTLC